MLIFVAYALSYTAIELIHNGTLESVSLRAIGFLGVNAVLISFAYIVIFILEKLFGFTSKVTLVELSDINNPTLRELSEECPGTFQHSMAVSNLASAAASRIGANVTLVRAGALYHDIGKIDNPAFFTENQHGVNPHDSLVGPQSARIVIGHVADGLRRAEKEKLLDRHTQLHLRASRTRQSPVFLQHMVQRASRRNSRRGSFHLPGSQSAFARDIHTDDGRRHRGGLAQPERTHSGSYLGACQPHHRRPDRRRSARRLPLSFRDVNIIKETFASRLRTMYHSRISYPELVK